MTAGIGLPTLSLDSLLNSLAGNSSNNRSERANQAARNIGTENHPGRHQGHDRLDISQEALNLIQTLNEGLETQQQNDLAFQFQRLQAVQEQIAFSGALLGAASSLEQIGTVLSEIGAAADTLQDIGAEIAALIQGSGGEISLDALFNDAAAGGGSTVVSYAESLNVEFNFIRVQSIEENISISQAEDGGIEIERTIEQTELVYTELNIEREQSLVIATDGGSGSGGSVRDLANLFQETVQQFGALLGQLQEALGGDDSGLADILEDLIETVLDVRDDQDDAPFLIDVAA